MTSLLQRVGLGKKPDPVEQTKEWNKKIKKEMRAADREIRELEREEKKFIAEVKKTAKLGTRGGSAVKTLAKNVVMARKAKERACMTRAQLNSVQMTLTHQIRLVPPRALTRVYGTPSFAPCWCPLCSHKCAWLAQDCSHVCMVCVAAPSSWRSAWRRALMLCSA